MSDSTITDRSGYIRQVVLAFKNWSRAILLVWESAPVYTTVWAVFLALQGVVPIAVVFLTKVTIDSIVAAANGGDSGEFTRALTAVVMMGGVLLLAEVLQHAGTWLRSAQAETFGDFLADKIHRKSAEVDLAFYESPEHHDLMERARGESSSKPLALLDGIGSVVQNTISLIGLCVILLTYGWWLPIVLVWGALPALYLTVRTDRQYHKWWKSTANDRRWAAYYDAMLTNGNAAMETRLFDLGTYFRDRYQSTRARLRNQKLTRLRAQGLGKIAAGIVALITAVGTIAWIASKVLFGQATLGDLGVFYQIFSRGQGIMSSLFQGVGKTVGNTLYLESLFAFLDLKQEITSPASPVPSVPELQDGIRFNSLKFYYPGSKSAAIKDLDLFIPAGQVVALVGVNGAGKTTLIKLLNRFYDPTEGSIEIDGSDLRQFDVQQLRRMTSVLFQFPMQYHASAKENIHLGDLERDENDTAILEAAQRAGAHDFISRLPDKYDTLLGKWFVSGTELSGGEWQRLALARAYFRRASIVVLDEPTSFMDSWSEADWFERFREMVVGKTSIVITHRFTIAMRADMIHVIDSGKIIESGTHSELLKSGGFYAKSWHAQMRTSNAALNGVSADHPALRTN